MKLISHRGNINGIISEFENNPGYIDTAMETGYDVELDLWMVDKKLYLGHDAPKFNIREDYITNRAEYLFIHCKNIEALTYLLNSNDTNLHFFWHETDKHTLTNKNIIWNYFESTLTENSICVLPELNLFKGDITKCYGICSDFIDNYKTIV